MSENNNGLLDRINRCEGFQNEIVETLQAITQVIGQSEVENRLGAIKRDKMAQGIAEAVKNGQLEPANNVAEGGVIVGQQKDKDGKVLFPGRFQVLVNDLVEEVRNDLLGKQVGATLKLQDGSVVKIEEIYDAVDPNKPEKPEPKKAKKAPTKIVKGPLAGARIVDSVPHGAKVN